MALINASCSGGGGGGGGREGDGGGREREGEGGRGRDRGKEREGEGETVAEREEGNRETVAVAGRPRLTYPSNMYIYNRTLHLPNYERHIVAFKDCNWRAERALLVMSTGRFFCYIYIYLYVMGDVHTVTLYVFLILRAHSPLANNM